MKKFGVAALLLCFLLAGLAGCGEGASQTGSSSGEYRNIAVSKEDVFREDQETGYMMDLQYYKGEAIQLWEENVKRDSSGSGAGTEVSNESLYMTNVVLVRKDGTREILCEDFPSGEAYGDDWYLVGDGSLYRITTDYDKKSSSLVKFGKTGEILYQKEHTVMITDICELLNGKMIVLTNDGGGVKAAQLSPDTGALTDLGNIKISLETVGISAGAEGLLVLAQEGVWKVNVDDGSREKVLAFSDSSYELNAIKSDVKDFRVTEDGGVELLRTDQGECVVETLKTQKVDNIPIVMRGFHFDNGWIKNRVAEFNRTNGEYQIVLEVPGTGESWDDFATRTSVEIASGKGPDILLGKVLSDYIQGMIDKGGFEDMAPYMAASGIREEDYFPVAFDGWRVGDKIYGINATMMLYRYNIDASVLGDAELTIENLVDALVNYEGKAAYQAYDTPKDILEGFLRGSETLWGMIDWETGACDFQGGLFAKMLEVAKRFAFDENQDVPILAQYELCSFLTNFDAPAIQEKLGRRTVGVLFDDGCHTAMDPSAQMLSINANSAQKQGAWAFIEYLLQEDAQNAVALDHFPPARRTAFEKMITKALSDLKVIRWTTVGSVYTIKGQDVENFRTIAYEDVDEAWIEAFRASAEDARTLPIRTAPILEIIFEEAEDYFTGGKGVEAVIDVIENRVRLYLEEHR